MNPSGRPILMMSMLYGYWAWQFFTAAGMTALWAVWKIAHLDPTGAFLIPVVGFFSWVGVSAVHSLRATLAQPRY